MPFFFSLCRSPSPIDAKLSAGANIFCSFGAGSSIPNLLFISGKKRLDVFIDAVKDACADTKKSKLMSLAQTHQRQSANAYV
jgi:hypothetical protein